MQSKKVKSFLLMSTSTLIMAAGVYFFKFTNNFTFGGVTGLAVLISKSGRLSASDFTLIANITLLIIGYAALGKIFAAKTTYCSLLLSFSLFALERFFPMAQPLTDQPVLELAYAISLPAIGSAMLFNIGASSGGTDVVAMILKRYSSIDIGKALLLTDFLIVLCGTFVFGIRSGLYSFLGLAIRSFLVDNFIESLNMSKYFNVVCSDPRMVCGYISQHLNRGATIVHARGAFSGNDKYIVITALNRMEAVKLRNFIHTNVPDAFMMISNTSEIIGKGFHSI